MKKHYEPADLIRASKNYQQAWQEAKKLKTPQARNNCLDKEIELIGIAQRIRWAK